MKRESQDISDEDNEEEELLGSLRNSKSARAGILERKSGQRPRRATSAATSKRSLFKIFDESDGGDEDGDDDGIKTDSKSQAGPEANADAQHFT